MPPEPSPTGQRGVVLVLYYADRAPLRSAIADHLYAFERYAHRPTLYVNVAARKLPGWLDCVPIDLVVFHTILLAQRWRPEVFERILHKLEPVKTIDAVKVAVPQDEFIQTDLLCRFLREFNVDHVFSCAPEGLWPVIYAGLADAPPTFTRVLTGYIEPTRVRRVAALARNGQPRIIDVGYRAWRPEPWLGRHGRLKGAIAEGVQREAPSLGLRIDVSLRDEDTLIGDDWYRFLLRCRWTIGVEGGASILDRDGSIRARTTAFTTAHPNASFEAVEEACFPGLDGTFGLVAISPRHLEACVTRTAQILVEGSYNDILRPWDHYLPVRRDLSDLPDVLRKVNDDGLRERLAARAYDEIVASGRFEYPAFVRLVLSAIRSAGRRRSTGRASRLILAWERRLDGPSWAWIRVRETTKDAARRALRRVGLLGPARGLWAWLQPRAARR